jgi:class 3 adenylate cyclase
MSEAVRNRQCGRGRRRKPLSQQVFLGHLIVVIVGVRPVSDIGRRRSVDDELDPRLVAVMFTDMVGYTTLFQVHERVAIDKRNRYTAAVDSSLSPLPPRIRDGLTVRA